MRRLIVSMNLTLDDCFSGAHCELDWHFRRWTPDMAERLTQELEKTETILLGRSTFVAMQSFWPGRSSDPLAARSDVAFAMLMNRQQKVVFSNTLKETQWYNSSIISGDLATQVLRLKRMRRKPVRNLIVYGSGKLVAGLLRERLVDELQLWIHPVALGNGKPLFRELLQPLDLRLLETKVFQSGVVLNRYAC